MSKFYDEIDYEGKNKALVCIPYGGGWSTIFHPWEKILDGDIAPLPIMFPGRGARIDEEPYNDLNLLVSELAQEIARIPLPVYIYGGCFGGMCGYEVIKRLRKVYGISVRGFFTNSLYAPENIDTDEGISRLEDDEFIEAIRRKGELPDEVIKDEEVMSFLLGGIRTDYTLYESYRYNGEDAGIEDTKISIFVKNKREMENEKYKNWSRYSTKELVWNIVECDNLFGAAAQTEIAKIINQMLKEDYSGRK